ncbi:hypothetical protein RI129_010772 [Pyrocoelia pectoralis]|uniref:Mos1 transposase HTH domain-containing protein n=1 Tax=Pyrocoelia pectoralis TaxID=417401 RepID=A0AAN7V7K1_9COLE
MHRSLDQRMAFMFCVKLEKTAAETIPMLRKAFGVDCLSDRQIFCAGAGRPLTSASDDNVKRVRDLLNTGPGRRLSVRLISETRPYKIVSECLEMRKVFARLVPNILTDDQKARRVETCQEFLDNCEENPTFLDDVFTGDVSWVFEYDPETKRQSAEWHTSNSPRSKKARMSRCIQKFI